jgi:hypothetical protein
MTTDRIKGITVLVQTDKGLFEAVISADKKKEIFKLMDRDKIVLVDDDWSKKTSQTK